MGEPILRESGGLINRDAFGPLARAATGVGDGQNGDKIRIFDVKNQVGKALDPVFSSPRAVPTRLTLRILSYLD